MCPLMGNPATTTCTGTAPVKALRAMPGAHKRSPALASTGLQLADVVKLVDTGDSHSPGICSLIYMPCGFNSRLRHQFFSSDLSPRGASLGWPSLMTDYFHLADIDLTAISLRRSGDNFLARATPHLRPTLAFTYIVVCLKENIHSIVNFVN